MQRLEDLRPGDRVLRSIADGPATAMTITAIEQGVVSCGPWRFDAATGAEIDDELGWGPPPGTTGSYIVPAPAHRVTLRFRTDTGSVYEVERNSHDMRWRRVEATLRFGTLRATDDWPLLEWPEIEVGRRAVLIGPPFVAEADARVVQTSRVVEVEDDPRRDEGDIGPEAR